MNPAIREIMEMAVRNAVAVQSRPCRLLDKCTDIQCERCNGTGLIIPHRYSNEVLSMLSVEVFDMLNKLTMEEDWESIADVAKWGQEYVTQMREHYFRTEFGVMDRRGINALADTLEERAELTPEPSVLRRTARAMRECDGTYKDFARLRKKYLGW